MIMEKAKLPELPRIGIEVELLNVVNECLRTQLDAMKMELPYDKDIIEHCNDIIKRYSFKLNAITSGKHLVEIE